MLHDRNRTAAGRFGVLTSLLTASIVVIATSMCSAETFQQSEERQMRAQATLNGCSQTLKTYMQGAADDVTDAGHPIPKGKAFIAWRDSVLVLKPVERDCPTKRMRVSVWNGLWKTAFAPTYH